VAQVQEPDFFTFNITEAKKDLGSDREFVGFRYLVAARLDSRVFEVFQVDLTAGDALVLPLDKILVGQRLAFIEGVAPVEIAGITPAQHLKDKDIVSIGRRVDLSCHRSLDVDLRTMVAGGIVGAALYPVESNRRHPRCLAIEAANIVRTCCMAVW
jgi:hypothetical protein